MAEKDEEKGYLIIEIKPGEEEDAAIKDWRFQKLPARPMVLLETRAAGLDASQLESKIKGLLNDLPVKMTAIDMDGMVDIIVPAGLPQGLYDISVHSPDGQSTTLAQAFQVE